MKYGVVHVFFTPVYNISKLITTATKNYRLSKKTQDSPKSKDSREKVVILSGYTHEPLWEHMSGRITCIRFCLHRIDEQSSCLSLSGPKGLHGSSIVSGVLEYLRRRVVRD